MNTIGTPVLAGLPDLCADLLTFIQSMRKAPDPGEYEPFRGKVEELFRSLETRAKESDVPDALTQQAKYALVAFLDETVLMSNWALKEVWSGSPLQLQFFNEFNAGEEFYSKIDGLRNTDDPGKLDALEVYYLCLSLGFKGKYGDLKGMEKIKVMTEAIAKELRKARTKGVEGLSPAWEPKDQKGGAAKEFPVWIVAVGCCAVLLLLYFILSSVLGSVSENIIKQVS